MELKNFQVTVCDQNGARYNINVVAADEFSARHAAEYSLSVYARGKTKVVGVIAGKG